MLALATGRFGLQQAIVPSTDFFQKTEFGFNEVDMVFPHPAATT
jgi:hypothetical protein